MAPRKMAPSLDCLTCAIFARQWHPRRTCRAHREHLEGFNLFYLKAIHLGSTPLSHQSTFLRQVDLGAAKKANGSKNKGSNGSGSKGAACGGHATIARCCTSMVTDSNRKRLCFSPLPEPP